MSSQIKPFLKHFFQDMKLNGMGLIGMINTVTNMEVVTRACHQIKRNKFSNFLLKDKVKHHETIHLKWSGGHAAPVFY